MINKIIQAAKIFLEFIFFAKNNTRLDSKIQINAIIKGKFENTKAIDIEKSEIEVPKKV
jgi:hypothetical protein